MIVWVNGPFGGGKTQTAHELQRRLTGRSFVSDPETVGFGLHRMTPPGLRGDFQDVPAWRQGVFEALDRAASGYDGVLLVPMTLVVPHYFDEIVGRLRERGHQLHHVALLASRETVLRRLRERGPVQTVTGLGRGSLKRESFAVSKVDECLTALARPAFAEQIHTDALTIPQVADRVAAIAGLTLQPADGSAVRQRARQTWVSVRHIRFG